MNAQTWQSVVAVCREWLNASQELQEDDDQDESGANTHTPWDKCPEINGGVQLKNAPAVRTIIGC